MSNPLKPCPFCGEPVKFKYSTFRYDEGERGVYLQCCFVVTECIDYSNKPRAKAEKQLAALWNMRH